MKEYYFQYRKKDSLVVSFSEKKNKVNSSILGQRKIKVSEANSKKLKTGHDLFIKKGKLKIKKRDKEILKDKRKKLIKKVREGKHTNKELADLLEDLTK